MENNQDRESESSESGRSVSTERSFQSLALGLAKKNAPEAAATKSKIPKAASTSEQDPDPSPAPAPGPSGAPKNSGASGKKRLRTESSPTEPVRGGKEPPASMKKVRPNDLPRARGS